MAGVPLDLVTLYLTLIQTLVAIMALVEKEEDKFMKNSFLVGSGTHGVVLNL